MVKEFVFSNDEAGAYAPHFDESLATMSEEIAKITKVQSILCQLLVRSSENTNIRIDEIINLIGEKLPLLERIFNAPHI